MAFGIEDNWMGSAYTDENGQAWLTLPEGDYRFGVYIAPDWFYSSEQADCSVPGCESAIIHLPVFGYANLTVVDTVGEPKQGVYVEFYRDDQFTGLSGLTNANGQVYYWLPEGDYRFLADDGEQAIWSEGSCHVPYCENTIITFPRYGDVTVTVTDDNDVPQADVEVSAYREGVDIGDSPSTDENGQAVLHLPEGNYRFQAYQDGQRYWSQNTCGVPGCQSASIVLSTADRIRVTVTDGSGAAQEGVEVKAYQGESDTGSSQVTDENGQAVFQLPDGGYHFRAEYNGQVYWSAGTCSLPVCARAWLVVGGSGSHTISYTYDALNRLTAADYADGSYFHYSYDAVGNRLSETVLLAPAQEPVTTTYSYDDANRLMTVNGVDYTWDDNGNLLSDELNLYTYDDANRLVEVTSGEDSSTYVYNGLGDRVQSTENGQTTTDHLDLAAGLTQVLDDGQHTYLYGNGRVGYTSDDIYYYLGDALGSVREIVQGDADGPVVMTRDYAPYGEVLAGQGTNPTPYGFTGEWTDASGLVYLRARYYSVEQGRFLSVDSWQGNFELPGTLNPYLYGLDNSVIYTDPSGMWCVAGFSIGPGRTCNPEEVQRWAGYYANEAQIWHQIGASSHQALGFVYGFAHEYLDAISVFGVSSIAHILLSSLIDCQAINNLYNPDVVAGRYAGRGFAAGQGLAELGYGLAGVVGGGGISLSGFGAIVGIPVSILSAAIAGHGALVVTHVITKELVDPLPNIFFSSGNNGNPYGTAPKREVLANKVAGDTGGKIEPVKSGNGWRITIEKAAVGKRNIVVRLMEKGGIRSDPYWRVGVDGKGGLPLSGKFFSNNPLLVHHEFTSSTYGDIIKLIEIAKTLGVVK